MDTKSINSKIDAAASKGKSLVADATQSLSDAAATARVAAVTAQGKVEKLVTEAEHGFQEAAAKVGHAAQELTAKVSHSAQEAAQKIAHATSEAASAAEHRRQEVVGKSPPKPTAGR